MDRDQVPVSLMNTKANGGTPLFTRFLVAEAVSELGDPPTSVRGGNGILWVGHHRSGGLVPTYPTMQSRSSPLREGGSARAQHSAGLGGFDDW